MKTSRRILPLAGALPAALAALLLTGQPARADYQTYVLGNSPLAFYPLSPTVDPTGASATDLSGNGNNGTYNGSSPQYNAVPGPSAAIPYALQFDGFSSWVDLSTGPNTGILNFSGPITLEAWVQPANSTSFGDILAKGYDASSYDEIAMRVNGPYGANYYASSGSAAVSGGKQNNAWTHVVLVNNGATTTLYLNGAAVQSTSDSRGAITFPDAWAIGDGTSAGNNRFFNGNLCQVAIYNYGLSTDAVFAHYFYGLYGIAPSNSIPIIAQQPLPQVSYTNGNAVFSVSLISLLPTTNQWYKNNAPLPGQTNSLLVLSNVQSGDIAAYSVTSGNSNGSTNSAAANLTLTGLNKYEQAVVGDQPLAYYPLDNSVDSAPLAQDFSGHGNFGQYVNLDPSGNFAAGPSAYIPDAVNFNGSSAYVDLSVGSQPGLLNFSGPISLEAWVEPSGSSVFGDIVAKGYDASTYQETLLRVNGSSGANYFGSSASAQVSGGQENPVWTHVVLSSDGARCSLYVNGVLVQGTSDTGGAQLYSDPWAIGDGTSAGATRYFNGNICQVAIYNHGLNTNQVLQHYYLGAFGVAPGNMVPVISSQPQPQSVYAGGTATFAVGVIGTLPTTNLWFKNNNPLLGQTNLTLVLPNVQSGDVASYRVVVGNANGVTNSQSADLQLLAAGDSLVWTSTNNTGLWDSGNSPNWVNLANSQQVVFNTGDHVLFDDTPGVPTSVTISGTVSPSGITVNSTNNNFNLNINGTSGAISGAGGLVKQGPSTLTIVSPGNFTGPVSISGGAVYAGNNSFSTVASVTITNNSLMDIGGGGYNTDQPLIISGSGTNGEGALFNSYNDYPVEIYKVTLAGDATFGGSARWDLGAGSSITGPHVLTVDWSAGGGYGEWNTVTVGTNVAGITLTNGNLGLKYLDTAFQNPATTFTVSTNCQLTFWNGGFNGSLHLLNGGLAYLLSAPAAFNGGSIILDDGAQWQSFYNSGDEPINSPVTLNGVVHIVVGDHNMIYTNIITGPGGFVFDYYNHAMVLSAANTYAGPTIVGGVGTSPALMLAGNGSISHSSLIFLGGDNPATLRLDVTSRPDQTLTLAGGQTLGGVGAINGSLVVGMGATLAPAGTNITMGITAGTNVTGTINVSNNVTLNGTTVIKLNGNGVSDVIQATGTINYGGTLNLTNISGADLAAGNSFQIFNAASRTGSFSVTPPTPGPGLAWDLSHLSSGQINVVAGSPQPIIGQTSVTGGKLILTGTGGTASGTYYVLATTNLAMPLLQWTVVSTNQFDASGNFSVTNPLTAGVPRQFYLLKE